MLNLHPNSVFPSTSKAKALKAKCVISSVDLVHVNVFMKLFSAPSSRNATQRTLPRNTIDYLRHFIVYADSVLNTSSCMLKRALPHLVQDFYVLILEKNSTFNLFTDDLQVNIIYTLKNF